MRSEVKATADGNREGHISYRLISVLVIVYACHSIGRSYHLSARNFAANARFVKKRPALPYGIVLLWQYIPRAQYAFQQFYADCGGPLFPNQNTSAYNYFIVLCDSATSFPFAYPLRSLTAKNIAEALIKTWTLTGVPGNGPPVRRFLSKLL